MINIFIDESGSFAPASFTEAWNVTTALVIPKPDMRRCDTILRQIKVRAGATANDEVKLGQIKNSHYIDLLHQLAKTKCTLFCVATDSGIQTESEIQLHRDIQAAKIVEHKDKMIYPEGVQMLETLSSQLKALSPQLYLQLTCQSELISEIVNLALLWYVQRIPSQMNGFRWRIDQKAPGTNNFEEVFRAVVPPFLQEKSLREPGIHCVDFDYSAMSKFIYSKEDKPTYLKDTYGIETNSEGALNVGKLIWDDFEFVDSASNIGVQLADLVASGTRKCLRGGFSDNKSVASSLGKLMIQSGRRGYPIQFITLSGQERSAGDSATYAANIFKRYQKAMMR